MEKHGADGSGIYWLWNVCVVESHGKATRPWNGERRCPLVSQPDHS